MEYEYVSQEEDELTIHPGDVIYNVQKLEGGWWEGELNGKKGVFPDNFVKVRELAVSEAGRLSCFSALDRRSVQQ